MRYGQLTREELVTLIQKIEDRIEFLKNDRTVWTSVWAYPEGHTPYNHGPYIRRLETRKLKAKLNRLRTRLSRMTP
jgi:hypothetical protein